MNLPYFESFAQIGTLLSCVNAKPTHFRGLTCIFMEKLADFKVLYPVSTSEDDHYLKTELYKLVQSEPAVFQFLQDGSLDGIWYWDLQNPAVEWMSPRMWEVFGFDPKEMPHLVEAWQDLIHPDDLKVAIDNFEKHVADPAHPYDQIVRYRHKDGSTVWVRCRGIAIRDENGTPLRLLGAHTEVTQLKEAEERLSRQAKQLRELNDELNQFAYAASHDLRSPINTLNALLERLHTHHVDQLDAQGQQLLKHALKTGRRMKPLAQGILRFSRLTHAKPEFETVDCNTLVQDVLEDLDDEITQQQATITVAPLPTVTAEPHMLRQVFQNLIANALKFRKPDEAPHIEISVKTFRKSWRFFVKDNGLGIDAEHQTKIFDLFARLHTQAEYTGTGLGLALCKKIVRLHRGTIRVQSTPEVGSTFSFTISKALGQ